MSYPFGITGIGYNPYMSGLGTYGLSSGGSFGSYGDPSMMGLTGGMGMMGFYNPAFMGQMTQAYQNIEKSQLEHSSAMHELLKQNQVSAYKADDRALFQKSMEDASLNGLIVNLAEKIREGDADGICEEFDKLKLALYQKHNAYLRANSDRLDPKESINNIIEAMYTQIISKKVGETVSLRSDIKKYGETVEERKLTSISIDTMPTKTTYNVGDIVNININLDQFASLSEVKLQIKIKEEYFEPVMVDNKYFYFSASSVFTNDVINDYVDHTYLRLRLIKDENISEGYFSSYKNNICNLQLKVKRPIDDIYNYFTIDNYDNMGISVYLFDVKDQIINYNLYHREKIKVNWQVESYELNVYSEVPDFKKDIQILNREIGEYEYLIEKQIDTMIIGLKTVHIGIYDKKAADYIVLSKAVSVVDKMAPIITYPSNITIEDNLIMTIDYFDYIDVNDNSSSSEILDFNPNGFVWPIPRLHTNKLFFW